MDLRLDGNRPNELGKRDNNTDRAYERYHDFKKREHLVNKKVKTEMGYIAFDRNGEQLYEYRKNMGKSYYVTMGNDGSYTYIDVDKKGKPFQIEQHNTNGEKQFTRSLNIKW